MVDGFITHAFPRTIVGVIGILLVMAAGIRIIYMTHYGLGMELDALTWFMPSIKIGGIGLLFWILDNPIRIMF